MRGTRDWSIQPQTVPSRKTALYGANAKPPAMADGFAVCRRPPHTRHGAAQARYSIRQLHAWRWQRDGPQDYLSRIAERHRDEARGVAHLHANQDLMLALRFRLAQCVSHIAGTSNRLTADLKDNVPGLKALFGCWTVWFHRGDRDALFARAGHFTRRPYF